MEFDINVAPLNLVFAGQYSAGKSSLIKMLTGIEHIKIGAGVTTDVVTQYQYKSINIWDTPGILAGECEQHDAKALEAIAKADLLIYVITNELFDDIVGAAFRDLAPGVDGHPVFESDGHRAHAVIRAHARVGEYPIVYGSTWEASVAAEIGAPLVEVSYPVTDEVVLNRSYIGYRGALQLIERTYTTVVRQSTEENPEVAAQ